MRWGWEVWGSCCRVGTHLPCGSRSPVLTTRNDSLRRVVWDHWYWQHDKTLWDVSCEIIGTDNTIKVFETCRVRSLVLTTRKNSFRRIVWDHWYWQHDTTLWDVSCEVIGTDNAKILIETCRVRSLVLTTQQCARLNHITFIDVAICMAELSEGYWRKWLMAELSEVYWRRNVQGWTTSRLLT